MKDYCENCLSCGEAEYNCWGLVKCHGDSRICVLEEKVRQLELKINENNL